MEYREAKLNRSFIIKFYHGGDVLAGIKTIVEREKVEAGLAFLIGALDEAKMVTGPERQEIRVRRVHAVPLVGVGVVSVYPEGEETLGLADLTPDQKLLLVALAEHRLAGDSPHPRPIPASAKVAVRLGWPITKFNRKLDNVCKKLDRLGVRGLLGRPGEPASGRRARLVQYTLGTGLITREDLALLDPVADREGG
jgi:hypothetical protein